MPVYQVNKFSGGISDFEDRGIPGAFKFGYNLDIRKKIDSLSCGQALKDEGLTDYSLSPSASQSPSASVSPSLSPSTTPSPSASVSPSSSVSGSQSASTGISPSTSLSPSLSVSPSASVSVSSSISPSPSPSSATAYIFKDLIIKFVKAKDGYTYGFGNAGHIYRRNSDGRWDWVYKDANGAIKGAEEKPDSNGNIYLYWATNNHLKKKEIPGNAIWNDVETVAGNLLSADWHTMVLVGGGLHIANGDTLAFVGYDGSYTPEALDLIPGKIAKALLERKGRTIIGTGPLANADKGIHAMIDSEVPLAQIGDDGELVFANMVDSMPAKRFPGGGKVNPGGVANLMEEVDIFEWEEGADSWIDKQRGGNLALFGVFGATSGYNGIYSYGRKNKNAPFVLNLDYYLDVDEIGAVAVVDGTVICSFQDGSDYGVKAVDSGTKAEAVYEGLDFRAPVKKTGEITVWNTAEVYMKPLPNGSWISFWYKINKNGPFLQATSADGLTNFTTDAAKKAVFSIAAEGEVFEPRLILHPVGNNGPEVFRIRTYFT